MQKDYGCACHNMRSANEGSRDVCGSHGRSLVGVTDLLLIVPTRWHITALIRGAGYGSTVIGKQFDSNRPNLRPCNF